MNLERYKLITDQLKFINSSKQVLYLYKVKNNIYANRKKKKREVKATIVKNMRDYSQDPFFVKKAESAKAFLKKHPLPPSEKKNK